MKVKGNKFKQRKRSKNLHLDEEIIELKNKYKEWEFSLTDDDLRKFSDFPLSRKTINGLNDSKYSTPTDIQQKSIFPSLLGKDVLGSAVTGSGKTLAFLIPILEHLYIAKWSRTDGIGAIIISPTRELAYQIFETLKKIGKHHDFSAGLIIGGKNLKFERKRMDQCNILICTPGRLLQHMDENPLFNATTMEILVLDEADRCLDMGFEKALNSIIENFPPDRQTLLFSATQTNSVKDLARLNLKNPVCIGHSGKSTMALELPYLLQQNYVVLPLEEKITMIWSFIKNHLKHKIIVFLASCKQVKFVYEMFCKLRPGISLLALYGTLHQDRRITIYTEFVKRSNVVMFATDVASRGLDFPHVSWVIQLDCPEDVTQYIHRAGRSARNKNRGESLLVLTPSEEEGMLIEMKTHQITPNKIQIDPKKLFSPRAKIEAFLAQNSELKASAQRAFLSYLKSVFVMKNKNVFKILDIDLDAFARSLGLVITPQVRFLDRFLQKWKHKEETIKEYNETNHDDIGVKLAQALNKIDNNPDSDDDDEDEFIKLKRADHDLPITESKENPVDDVPLPLIPKREKKIVTKAALARKAIKKKIQINEKVIFNDEGEQISDNRKMMQSEMAKEIENMDISVRGGINIELSKKLLQEEDKYDKQRFRELVKQRHKKLKEKKKHVEKNVDKEENVDNESIGNIDDNLSEGDNESIDLSWLPDPDKIYSNKRSIDADDDGDRMEKHEVKESSDDDDDDEMYEPVRKKKVTSKLTLNDAEVIATQLLANY